MSYALDTTKRKFHRILDAITNSSSSSLPLASPHNASSSSLGVHHAPKRARFERPQSAYSPSTTQTALNAERAKPLNAKITSETDEQPRMSYAPWDRGQFLDRLKTFSLSVVDWSPKLDVMNEVEWAKRGWKCVGKETVSCTGCAKRMIINLEVQAQPVADGEDETSDTERDASRENAYNELAEKYSRLLVNNHYEGCLWKRRGCDDAIYRLPLGQPATAIDALRKRYESLLTMHKVLPTSVTVPGRIDARTAFNQYQTLPSSTQEPQSATNDTTPGEELSSTTKNSSSLGEDLKFRAFCFALFGWYGDSSGTFTSQELASCNACFRRLGLWLWNPRPRPDGTTLEPCKSTMEVGSEHRHYCPWTNAATQNNGMNLEEGEASLAGFETLLRVISNAARIARPRPTSVGVPHGQLLSPQDSQGQKSPSKFSTKTRDEDAKSRDEKDKKRISLMKRLSNSFRVKKVKKPGEEKAAGST